MSEIRVMHYLNQFFVGVGGEDKADVPLGFREGPVGAGKRLQALLGESAKIVVTTYCGDNYFSAHINEVVGKILQIVKNQDVQMVIAGPAFNAGRYGFACTEVCHFLSDAAGLNCVMGMHVENPGAEGYRQYKDRKVFLFPTTEEVSGMEDALSRMARFVSKLAAGSTIGLPSEEGYIPRGIRSVEVTSKSGVERAVDMLVNKLAGRPFATEIPIKSFERIPVTAPIAKLKEACIALVTTSGVVAPGNPDGFKVHKNTIWRKYSIDKLDSMTDARWDVAHGGYNTIFMCENTNYGVPLDACRELEREGAFARLYPYFYTTPGSTGTVMAMQAIGRQMVLDMKAEGVDAAVVVST